jgi:GNAT superfamily N-acetyltransferase
VYPQINFRPIDLRSASQQEYECLGEFKNILNKEYFPDDPPIPLEEQIQGWKNIPAFDEMQVYAGWNAPGTKIIALSETSVEHTEDNQHISYFRLEVLPEYRCQGLGREMLGMALSFARKHNRRLLMVWASDRITAAGIFLEHIGARKGLQSHTNQLKISEFDRNLMERWLNEARPLQKDFNMSLWEGPIPEERIQEIATLMGKLANDEPREDLEIEDMKITPEMLREYEKFFNARGTIRWLTYLTDRNHGNIIGFTEVYWNPNRPAILNQGFTAVDAVYRNQGMGHWLKAATIQKILRERPEVEYIRTGNANSNAPMLKINREMGFKPYFANILWQVDMAQVEKYLNEKI